MHISTAVNGSGETFCKLRLCFCCTSSLPGGYRMQDLDGCSRFSSVVEPGIK